MTTIQTPAQKRLILLLRCWMVLFTLAGASFYLIPDQLFSFLNFISLKTFPSLNAISVGNDRFWLSLSMSLMATLVFICYLAQKNLTAHLAMVRVLLLSKFASTLFFFVSFIVDKKLGAYMAALLVDGLIFLITYIFYQPVSRELKNYHFDK